MWEPQIDRSLVDLLAEVETLRRRLDDLERMVASLARAAGRTWGRTGRTKQIAPLV